MGKLMFNRLASFLKNNILDDNQFWFRSMLITDKIQRAIENKVYSCRFFLDFSKAFDTVDHSILLPKLEHYEIPGLPIEWLSYFNYYRVILLNL